MVFIGLLSIVASAILDADRQAGVHSPAVGLGRYAVKDSSYFLF